MTATATQPFFASPLSDEEVGQQYPQFAAHLSLWREPALSMNHRGSIVSLVKPGFTLKTNAPMAGPCYDDLNYLKTWKFVEVPTEPSLVFWIPVLAPESTGKNIDQMVALRAELKRRYELPGDHATTFGSIDLLSALILSRGKLMPLSLLYAASDTLREGARLIVGCLNNFELFCTFWKDTIGYSDVGFFLLGVEKLGRLAEKAGK